ncbi:MAG: hypothetical protein M1823_004834 [Watsoniomyces obsoletus]|nr:MAG: hypothetical protein M1823_004834 [Watsoniomyces obsoletus]
MEVNRLSRPTENQEGIQKYILDGVITVIDVENWKGYEDTSFTAKLQARFTDLVVWNKWEDVDERRFDECLDRLADLEVDVATVRSKRGWVPMKALLGLDRRMEVRLEELESRHEHEHHESGHDHDAEGNHHSEVEVLSISLMVGLEDGERRNTVMDVEKLEELLKSAPKDEVYRIKAIMKTDYLPLSSDGISSTAMGKRSTNGVEINGFKKEDGNNDNEIGNWEKQPVSCILNWAFGRWTFFEIPSSSSLKQEKETGTVSGQQKQQQQDNPDGVNGLTKTVDPILRMTVVLARGEGEKWKKRIQQKKWLCVKNQDENESILTVEIKR